ncbi:MULTISPECIES: tocopherol cyclase family protein [Streptomyces]|uniref:tocopherol cyclase family protein n=1 Tax=Streptomyces TaxID=1883 RepID=UPI00099BA885|nr:tocopherol cyclase family protein [Streptomyces virginiae]
MLGSVQLHKEAANRPMRLDLTVESPQMLHLAGTTSGTLRGRVRIVGAADDREATGEITISPFAQRRIRYRIAFKLDTGRRVVLEGWKSIQLLRPVRSMTTLPVTLYEDESVVGTGVLRFPLTTLIPFLLSFRRPHLADASDHWVSRWRGQAGRTEVWYTTLTDPITRTGVWLHHELVAPTDGTGAYAHGWIAVYPPDGPVSHERFGPVPWTDCDDGFNSQGVSAILGQLRGVAGSFTWDLTEQPEDSPLFTFPQWSWYRELLPAAQMLPAARSTYSGTISHEGGIITLDRAPGASARIYGHGNGQKWAWLHADLGGGTVLEIVAASSTRRLLRRLPPMVFLQLRHRGKTWPRRVERSALGWVFVGRFRAQIGQSHWSVSGRSGLQRIRVEVDQPDDKTLVLDYTDPDGSSAVCRNSEAANAKVVMQTWWGRWRTSAEWSLRAGAHAEVGSR